MNLGHVTDHPMLGYLNARRIARAARRGSLANLGPIIEGAGWILAGAVLGSAAIVAGIWVLLQFSNLAGSFDDSAEAGISNQQPLAR